jgi:hypothetical protein
MTNEWLVPFLSNRTPTSKVFSKIARFDLADLY